MSIRCFFPSCLMFPSTLISCNQQNLYSCSSHCQSHFELCGSSHNCESLLKNISCDKFQMINKVKKVLKWSNDMTQKTIHDYNQKMFELTSFLKNALTSLKAIKNHCSFMIEKITKANKVPIFFNTKALSYPEISQDDLNPEFTNLYKNAFIKKGTTTIDSSQRHKEIEDSLSLLLSKEFVDKLDNYLDFFIGDSKILVSFYIISTSYTKKFICLQENQGILNSICRISANEIFVSGGNINIGQLLNETLDNSFIINTNNTSITVLPKGFKRSAAQPLLFDKKIYIFGGESYSQNIKESHMFDLNSKTWRLLAPLVTELSCTSTLLLKNDEILLIGTNVNGKRYLLGYNTIANRYSDYNLDYSDKKFHINLLIKSDDKVIIIGKNNLLVTEANNIRSWRNIGKSYMHSGIISQVIVRDKKAYFIDSKHNVYAFCLETFQMNNLLKII